MIDKSGNERAHNTGHDVRVMISIHPSTAATIIPSCISLYLCVPSSILQYPCRNSSIHGKRREHNDGEGGVFTCFCPFTEHARHCCRGDETSTWEPQRSTDSPL